MSVRVRVCVCEIIQVHREQTPQIKEEGRSQNVSEGGSVIISPEILCFSFSENNFQSFSYLSAWEVVVVMEVILSPTCLSISVAEANSVH